MLLSDEKVRQVLNDEVIPCWQMVREVPKVTIDFGGGRVLKRTLVGNTVMYLCTPDGRVIDALPGVYTPNDFLAEVRPGLDAFKAGRTKELHTTLLKETVRSEQIRVSMSKSYVESPLLEALGVKPTVRDDGALVKTESGSTDKVIERLARLITDVSKQPKSSDDVLRESGIPEGADGSEIVAEDSRNNRRFLRPAIHLYLSQFEVAPTPAEITEDIFSKMFEIDLKDPYLGLAKAIPGTPGGG